MRIAKVVYLFILLFSIWITPHFIEYATTMRGYKAYGGEYLIPILGWIIATVFYEICKEINKNKKIEKEKKEHE